MIRYLLDTVTLIHLGRHSAAVAGWLQRERARHSSVGVCGIVVTELLSRGHPEEMPAIDLVLANVDHWPILHEDAVDAGMRRYALARRGIQAQLTDALIAAVARRMGATVVSENVADFMALGIPVVDPGR